MDGLLSIGGLIWIRRSSKFYKALKKPNRDGTFTFFYNSRFPPSGSDCASFHCTQSFIGELSHKSVYDLNYIVEVLNSTEYSMTAVGKRVIVEEGENIAALGTVILKTAGKVTVRLDSNGSDIIAGNKKVYLLPFQLDRHGEWIFIV